MIGLICGTGLENVFSFMSKESSYTPFGTASTRPLIGMIDKKEVAMISRHGNYHEIPPHEVNYRANMFALRSAGINKVIGVSAVGALTKKYSIGDIILPWQLIDNTKKRKDTFFDKPQTNHIPFAHPFCRNLLTEAHNSTENILDAVKITEDPLVVIEGPRFSTMAESNMYRTLGAGFVGMTTYPECVLARELGMCYISVLLVTDYDNLDEKDSVSHEKVQSAVLENKARLEKVISMMIGGIKEDRICECQQGVKKLKTKGIKS